jgi:hypothetical protein
VLRVPARFAMLAVLCQSIAGSIVLARWAAGRRGILLTVAVGAGLLADGWMVLPVAAAAGTPSPLWSDVAAIVELPPGRPEVDFPAIARSLEHRRPIVNGYSGYAPPHYLPLAHAVRDGKLEALEEIAAYGRIGVAVERSRADAADLAAMLRVHPGMEPGPPSDRWFTFVVAARVRVTTAVGAALPLQSIRANVHDEDLHRLADGSVLTAWGSGGEQHGGEAIVADLGVPQEIGAIVFELGAYSFGHPRDLRIETSADGLAWSEVWRGSTAVQTVRATLADPDRVPVTIGVPRVTARFVRLTQIGQEPGIPWWVAELQVRAPAR